MGKVLEKRFLLEFNELARGLDETRRQFHNNCIAAGCTPRWTVNCKSDHIK